MFGLVASQVVNFSTHKPKEQLEPMDFFRKRRKVKARPPDGWAFMAALDRTAHNNRCEIIDIVKPPNG